MNPMRLLPGRGCANWRHDLMHREDGGADGRASLARDCVGPLGLAMTLVGRGAGAVARGRASAVRPAWANHTKRRQYLMHREDGGAGGLRVPPQAVLSRRAARTRRGTSCACLRRPASVCTRVHPWFRLAWLAGGWRPCGWHHRASPLPLAPKSSTLVRFATRARKGGKCAKLGKTPCTCQRHLGSRENVHEPYAPVGMVARGLARGLRPWCGLGAKFPRGRKNPLRLLPGVGGLGARVAPRGVSRDGSRCR
jgi:hypothetical protein